MYHKATFRAAKLSYPEINGIYKRIGAIKDSFGVRPSPRPRAETLIVACIAEGVDTQYEIEKMLGATGLSKNLVRSVLKERTGPLPGYHLWQPDEHGRFRLLDSDA